ncbi:MAG: sensor domain-containing diguanylate cyclase [Spirochaetota bacterium]
MSRPFRYLLASAVLMGLFFPSCCRTDMPSGRFPALGGVLDLRQWDPSVKTGLAGEWEYFPFSLIDPASSPGADPAASAVLPCTWEDFRMGYASYRLKVLLPENRSSLAVRTHTLSSAFALYADGVPVVSAGTVGTAAGLSIPSYSPQVARITPHGAEMELVLHVSNFHYREGGPWRTIWIGDERLLRTEKTEADLSAALLAGGILVIGLYHLVLYLFRRKEKQYFFFSLFCLFIAVRTCATGEYLLSLFPQAGFSFLIRAEYISFCLALGSIIMFVQSLFPGEGSVRVSRVSGAVTVLSAVIVAVLPVEIFTWSIYFDYFLLSAVILWLLCVVLRAVKHGRQGSVVFMTGGIVLALSAVNDMLYGAFVVRTGNFVDAGLLFFIFMQAIVLSRQFTAAFTSAENIAVELERKVEERTAELSSALDVIRDLSVRDSLTGAYNRRYIDEHLPREINRALRYRHSFSVILGDIDYFKLVNDTFGHLAGDAVLKAYAGIIGSEIREKIDWCGRYGGEEFLIILPETPLSGAAVIAERIRVRCMESNVFFDGRKIRFTSSFGVTGFDGASRTSPATDAELFQCADDGLYRAKREGRNRAVMIPFVFGDESIV